ncbi:MAG: RecQ family ATP-dependent DNA helicase [Prevotella sp.]|nr:RecQ family ATP-dependent DNA helicase [Prevotella sp.]
MYLSILKRYWGYDSFRGVQRDIIESIGEGRDTLGLMPTGGGKSITFQVPALALDGVCIVITPLIALMKDQVAHLRQRNIRAAAIYGSMSRDDIIQTLENAIFGGIKILYVSPERLASDLFQKKLSHMNISFVTVDEAHCISQWGYDFRPAYLEIANIRKLLANSVQRRQSGNTSPIPILALTATATPKVVDDIQERLLFEQKNVFSMSFERSNLAYVVRTTDDKLGQLTHILSSVSGSAIVYVRSRRKTKEIADHLNKLGFNALAYHAGLDSVSRDERQQFWHEDHVRIMVATNAFGMGIDKPDVRLVIHMDCPDSLEAYFQEAGRAGRDGNKSYAVLLYNHSDDLKLKKRIADNFPDKDYIRRVYDSLAYFYQIGVGSGYGHAFQFNIDLFCHNFHLFPLQVNAALMILMRAGYIDYDEERDTQARVHFLITRDKLYLLDHLSPNENNVITALLRNYGGLFSDYAYIDLPFLAKQANLKNQQQVYMILKNLSERRIISFIPQQKIPYITYTQSREDGERLIISPAVYEERKAQFTERIEQMISYANNDHICRSRQLLRYFGETRSTDCGQCDVCLNHREDDRTQAQLDRICQHILDLLADKLPHNVTELEALPFSTEQISTALKHLVNEEHIRVQGSRMWIDT